jgi:tripartite-type tricarboxylate transporter receptor subunit TctC
MSASAAAFFESGRRLEGAMKIRRRQFLHLAAGAAALPVLPGLAFASLAITSKRRSQILPDVPTMTEAGYPEIGGDSWVGILVPAGTSKDIVSLLNREVLKIIAMPDMEARLAKLGYDPVASTPEEFAVRIKAEIESWARVIKAAHIKAE